MYDSVTIEDCRYAERLFLSPTPTYSYGDLIRGVTVTFDDGTTERRKIFAANTSRAFVMKDKHGVGAAQVFDDFMLANEEFVLDRLRSAASRDDVDTLSEDLRGRILPQLTNIEDSRLHSYGRTRKPVDLYLENLGAMAAELSSVRAQVIPLLCLPLDSKVLTKVFGREGESFGSIENRGDYVLLQKNAVRLADRISQRIGAIFHPIYFDICWRGRLDHGGGNLHTSSRMRKTK